MLTIIEYVGASFYVAVLFAATLASVHLCSIVFLDKGKE